MVSTAASVAPSATNNAESDVSLVRLYVLRAAYLLLVVGLGAMIVPPLISHEPMARGVIPSLLGALWLLSFLGLRYPLTMLPLLIFEFAWKTIWLLDFGLPQWFAGKTPPTAPDRRRSATRRPRPWRTWPFGRGTTSADRRTSSGRWPAAGCTCSSRDPLPPSTGPAMRTGR